MRSLIVLLLLLAAPVHAFEEGPHRFTIAGGGEAWNDEDTPWHGVLIVGYENDDFPDDSTLRVLLNTDTLRLGLYGVELNERLWLDFEMAGEAFVAGLLPDYYFEGKNVLERGFSASYVRAEIALKARLLDKVYFELEVAGRKWFLADNDDTDDALVLPDDPWVFEPRLHYTYWCLGDDEGWRDLHRLYPRLRGYAFGLTVGLDLRDDTDAWGARDPDAFTPVDSRNDPERLTLHASAWAKTGWQMHSAVRSQLEASAGVVEGGDDLVRPRVGGLNPYVVPLVGAPWASWLPDAWAGGLWSWHFRAFEGFELGPLATLVVLNDPGRVGEEEKVDALWGVGALIDWRIGDAQIDLRGGWSPAVEDYSNEAAWSVWLSGGWAGWF